MPPTPTPLLNGHRFDFSSIRARIRNRVFTGFKSINYSDNCEPGEVFGTHAQMIGRTRGQYKAEASIEIYKAEFNELVEELGDGFYEEVFDLEVSYSERLDSQVFTDRVIGCRIKKTDQSNSSGNEAIAVKLDLHPMYITWNGKSPMRGMLAGPQ